jgi:hypothetical protein
LNGAKVGHQRKSDISALASGRVYLPAIWIWWDLFREVIVGDFQKQGIQGAVSQFGMIKFIFIPTMGMIWRRISPYVCPIAVRAQTEKLN